MNRLGMELKNGKLFVVLFIFFMSCLLPTVVAHAAVSGDWTYMDNGDGTATITGNSSTSASVLTIPDTLEGLTVTTIASDAFIEHPMTGVVVPGTVTTINSQAFKGCTALASVDIAEGLTFIGSYAFQNCAMLTSIAVPDSVETIEEGAFYSCILLETVVLPDTLTDFPKYLFYANRKLTVINFPSALETVGYGAFYSCSALPSITLPSLVSSIGERAFSYCDSIVTLDLSNTIITEVPADMFIRGNKLDAVYLPDTVKTISATAFRDCLLNSINLPEGLETLGNNAFDGCTQLGSITLPSTLTTWGGGTFVDCYNLTSVGPIPEKITVIPGFSFQFTSISSIEFEGTIKEIGNSAFRGCDLVNVVLPEGIEIIDSCAFWECADLETIVLPESLDEMGDMVFEGCTSLVSVDMPEEMSYIGWYAFYGCVSLESLIVPDGITKMERYSYSGLASLREITIPNSVTEIYSFPGKNAYGPTIYCHYNSKAYAVASSGNHNIVLLEDFILEDGTIVEYLGAGKDMTIREGITGIADNLFVGDSRITSVLLPMSLTTLGENVFSGCSELTSVTAALNIESIGKGAFTNNNEDFVLCGYNGTYPQTYAISNSIPFRAMDDDFLIIGGVLTAYSGNGGRVIIPDNVTHIAQNVFKNNTTITSLITQDGLLNIGDYAFSGCTNLEEVILADTVNSIGNYVFSGCTNLQKMTWADTLRVIGDYAFSLCVNLISIDIPDAVTEINDYMFSGCSKLAEITWPDTIDTFDDGAFSNCDELVDITLPADLRNIGDSVFSDCDKLNRVVLPEGLIYVGVDMFNNCPALETVVMPSTMVYLFAGAFYNCTGLTSFLVQDGILAVGAEAFFGCTALTDLQLKEGLTYIADSAFNGCTGLSSVEIPNSVELIDNGFSNCASTFRIYCHVGSEGERYAKAVGIRYTLLEDFIMEGDTLTDYLGMGGEIRTPDDVSSIADGAFSDNVYVVGVIIEDEVTSIGANAFSNCANLEYVSIGSSVTSIGANAFLNNLDGFEIRCYAGTDAESYAIANDINYRYIDDVDFDVVGGVLSRYTGLRKHVVLPGDVREIESGVFRDQMHILSVTTTSRLNSIGDFAFYNCDNLQSINFEEGLISIGYRAFKFCESLSTVILPDTVSVLGDEAFAYCTDLISAVLPASITSVPAYSFDCDQKLQTVVLPETITEIERNAFYMCTGLENINFPNGLVSVGYNAFVACRSLTELSLPDSMMYIDTSGFESCSGLTHLELPYGMTEIGSYVFYGTTSLSSITIPTTVVKIKDTAFSNTSENLKILCYSGSYAESYAIAKGIPVVLLDTVYFNISSGVLLGYSGDMETVEIPDTVISIAGNVFAGNSTIKHVIIPSSVTTIGDNVLNSCSELLFANVPSSVTEIGEGAFLNCSADLIIYCEEGSVMDAYAQAKGLNVEYRSETDPIDIVLLTELKNPTTISDFGSRVWVSAEAFKYNMAVADAEYRFSYRIAPSTSWILIDKEFSTENGINFYPTKEGEYYFKVEARTSGSTATETVGYDDGTVIEIGYQKAQKIDVRVVEDFENEIPKDEFLTTEDIPLIIRAIDNGWGSSTLEFSIEYSTNGKTFKSIDGGRTLTWWEFDPDEEGGDAMSGYLTLPVVSKDTEYTIRVNLRTQGRQGIDTSDIVIINSFPLMPLASVTLDSVGDTTAGQAVTEAGITLTATAANKAGYAETPTYRFAYRMEGSAKWAYIGKAFSEDNTIRFVPKTEGTYYFKVEAQSLGRKTKAGDVWDYDYTAYALSNTAEPVKGIYSLTSDEKDYINGETVTLTMDITQNTAGDDVEYQLLYSTNGKSFKPFSKEYAPLAVTAGKAEIEAPALPLVKKDTIYYLKVQVRTIGRTEKEPDAFAMTQVEFKTAHPVEAGEVAVIGVGNDAAEQSVDAEGITLTATERANTEYRFAYQKLGDTKWSYVSSKWSTERTITFVPKTDGRYQFCVEARSLTRTTTDTTSAATGYYGLYYLSLGAESASVAVDGPTEFVNDVEGIHVPLTFSAAGNGSDAYDLRYTYSTNGKSFKVLYDWSDNGSGAVTDGGSEVMLPAVKKDTHYWIRLEAKTNSHTTADVFDTAEVDVYMVEPLTSMDSFVSDADSGLAVLGAVDDVLTLTATANDDAAYKFYYRTVGTDKWSSISSKYVVENQAYFRPKTEGAYEFKAEATALGRKAKTADVSAELSEPIDIWFTAEPAHWISLGINDDDADYIIGLDSEMSLEMEADGTDAGMEYQIVYSNNGGKSYKPLSAWQPLSATSTFDDVASCALPTAKKDTLYLIKAQVRSTGRTTADAESEAEEIWLLSQEREVDADLIIPGETHEYTETITANIAISEPASGEVEYQLQYSTDNKKWNDLSAHDWSVYDDGGTGSINVELDLAELNGDMTAYIKLNARMKNSTKIEDSDVDRFDIYSIGPVSSVDMGVLDTDENYALIEASAVSSFAHTAEYRYSYALAGQSKMTWIPFTSWTVSDEVTFTPSLSGDYLFMVEARSKGRLTVDATAEATNEDSGYYLKSIEDMLLPEPVPEPSAAPTPSEAPTVIPSAVPSEAPSTEPSTEPSASPSATPAPKLISSLEYATSYVLGENADLDSYTEQEVALEDILSVLADEDAPMILVQLGEETFAVITGYEADEDSNLKRLTLTDQMGETILGGTEGILRAWVYTSAEPEVSEAPSETPSGEPSIEPAPESEASEAPAASESPSAQPSETPAA